MRSGKGNMKRIIRNNVFETNSSAQHTLCISSDGLEPSKLPVDKDGYIVIDFGYFPNYDEGIITFDQATKLSYIATECYYLNHWDTHIEDSYAWQNICKAICKYTGAPGVCLLHKTEPELNHQAMPEYELKFCDYWNEDSIINFVFNKFVGINMSHD